MLSVKLWLTFVGTAIGVVFIPGPGVLLTMAHSLEYGARRTLGTIGGCLTANLFHQMLVAAGVGGLVAQYPGVLEALKYFGAAYLIYLGIRQIVARPRAIELSRDEPCDTATATLFLQGFSVMVMNPRSFVFFLAFFPLFIDPAKPIVTQFVILGLTFALVGASALLVYASCATRLTPLLVDRHLRSVQTRMIGALLALSGLWFGFR